MLAHIFLLVITLIYQNSIATASPALSGIWRGTGRDSTGNYDSLLLTADPTHFIWRIDYGKNGNPFYCGGYWSQTGVSTFRETIIYGTGSCAHSFITLTFANATVMSYAADSFTGTLNRLYTFC